MGTTRDILNYLGVKIGEMELPVETTEEQWQEKLAPYSIDPNAGLMTKYLVGSIKDRRAYADDLIERFKLANMQAGISASQAMWLQHKMRALNVSFYGLPLVIDMMNLIVSGDAEVACLALMNCEVDDMTQSYHFFSAARRDWLVADLKKYLGWL